MPTIGPLKVGILGALFYTSVIIVEYIPGVALKAPSTLDLVILVTVESLFLFFFLKVIGRRNHEIQLISFAAGLVVPIATFGVIAEIKFPLVILVDLIFPFSF